MEPAHAITGGYTNGTKGSTNREAAEEQAAETWKGKETLESAFRTRHVPESQQYRKLRFSPHQPEAYSDLHLLYFRVSFDLAVFLSFARFCIS